MGGHVYATPSMYAVEVLQDHHPKNKAI